MPENNVSDSLGFEGEFAQDIEQGIWKTGDVYEPDASERLDAIVRSRTGLPEGPEFDRRVRQVAVLNQYVSTDSLRSAWEAIKALPDAVVADTLETQFETLAEANDVLTVDSDRLQSLLEEAEEIVRAGSLSDEAAYRLQILAQRAIVPYLPESITFPFALNLPGQVTAMASRNRTLYVGTTRGLLMYVDGSSVALNDSAAGPAAGIVHDVQVTPSGVLWPTSPGRFEFRCI